MNQSILSAAKTALVAALLLFSTHAYGAEPKRPAIVIGITVEGLSTDYLRLLDDLFLQGGFKRLQKQGIAVQDLHYGPGLDAAAATAMLYTGAAPAVNGIPAGQIFDTERLAPIHILHDPSKIGNFTNETYSPDAITVSTISDEIRIDSRGDGLVFSVGATPLQAILSAGHSANGAFWLNDKNGHWATTTYYTDVPRAISDRNYKTPLASRIDTMVWTPLLDTHMLPGLSDQKKIRPFKHGFSKKKPEWVAAFKASALGNREITSLAIELIQEMGLGKHTGMDMLNVAYTLAPFSYGHSTDSSLETLDAYIRLDRDIARLIDAATQSAGAGNVAVFLAGVPTPSHEKRDDIKWRIPYGQFSVKKAESLLNMYLMALHGNGNWITGYFNNNFFLNRKLIKDKSMDLTTVRAEAADFLNRMSGIADVYTIDDIIAARVGDEPQALKRNTSVRHSGDVIIRVAPGWEVTDDGSRRPPVIRRESQSRIPAFIMGPGIAPKTVDSPVDARVMAPSIARSIWLRAPNGASQPASLITR
ncbi:MAG: alkaline phosphatase family protein [Muribaculaceae bacterium]|nr:alkaline phosphatase family protein [Muribaculaceae bacterium]